MLVVAFTLKKHKNLSFLKAAHFPGHCQSAASAFVVPAPPLVVDLVMVGGGGAQWWWMWRNLADQSTPHLRQDQLWELSPQYLSALGSPLIWLNV